MSRLLVLLGFHGKRHVMRQLRLLERLATMGV